MSCTSSPLFSGVSPAELYKGKIIIPTAKAVNTDDRLKGVTEKLATAYVGIWAQ